MINISVGQVVKLDGVGDTWVRVDQDGRVEVEAGARVIIQNISRAAFDELVEKVQLLRVRVRAACDSSLPDVAGRVVGGEA